MVSDDLQPDNSSVIKMAGNEMSRLEFGITEKTVNTKLAGCKAVKVFLIQPMMVQCRQVISMRPMLADRLLRFMHDNAATPGALYQNCWLRNSDGNCFMPMLEAI
ncbi:MAG: hypothetical protein ACLU0O_09355 [Collinsella sp.]